MGSCKRDESWDHGGVLSHGGMQEHWVMGTCKSDKSWGHARVLSHSSSGNGVLTKPFSSWKEKRRWRCLLWAFLTFSQAHFFSWLTEIQYLLFSLSPFLSSLFPFSLSFLSLLSLLPSPHSPLSSDSLPLFLPQNVIKTWCLEQHFKENQATGGLSSWVYNRQQWHPNRIQGWNLTALFLSHQNRKIPVLESWLRGYVWRWLLFQGTYVQFPELTQ